MGILSSVGARLTDWIHAGSGQPLARTDAKLWGEACTLEDLGRLTAMYLCGDIASRPGVYGPSDVDDGAVEDTLVACNLAGFVTANWMPGLEEDGWTQRAAVNGYADDETLAWLMAEVMRPGQFEVRAWKHSTGARAWIGWSIPEEDSCPVAWLHGAPVTDFGRHTAGAVRDFYDGCSDEAIAAAVAAWQVTVYDPEPGRNDLWAVLYDAATQNALTPTGAS